MEEMKDRLKAVREELGLKQRELAERLGVSTGRVGSWECGLAAPGKTRLYQLCNEFHVSQTWLETGEGEMFVEPDVNQIFREQIVKMFEELPEDYKKLWLSCARAVVEANGCTNTAINDINKAVEEFENRDVGTKVDTTINGSHNTTNINVK